MNKIINDGSAFTYNRLFVTGFDHDSNKLRASVVKQHFKDTESSKTPTPI